MIVPFVFVTIGALLALYSLHQQAQAHREAQAQWALERRELLNRVQRPEIIPAPTAETWKIPVLPKDEFDLIGTVQNFDPEKYMRPDEPAE